ncbi:hypothetical protein Tco_0829340 [Tanacetum coccineum]
MLIKAVLGSLRIYFLSLFKAPAAGLKTLENARGLAIGSLKSFNLALLHKWRLRFYSNPDSHWVKVIGALEKMALIIMVANIAVYGLRLSGLLITGIQAPSFPWIPFAFRLFRLEQEKDCLVVDRISNGQWAWSLSRSNLGVRKSTHLNHMLSQISQIKVREDMDKCTWSLAHDGMFSFGNLRRLINDRILPSLDTKTTWD